MRRIRIPLAARSAGLLLLPKPPGFASRGPVWEDPDALGYHLGADPLLAILPAEEWRAMEHRALSG